MVDCLQTPLRHIKKEFLLVAATKPAAGNEVGKPQIEGAAAGTGREGSPPHPAANNSPQEVGQKKGKPLSKSSKLFP